MNADRHKMDQCERVATKIQKSISMIFSLEKDSETSKKDQEQCQKWLSTVFTSATTW